MGSEMCIRDRVHRLLLWECRLAAPTLLRVDVLFLFRSRVPDLAGSPSVSVLQVTWSFVDHGKAASSHLVYVWQFLIDVVVAIFGCRFWVSDVAHGCGYYSSRSSRVSSCSLRRLFWCSCIYISYHLLCMLF